MNNPEVYDPLEARYGAVRLAPEHPEPTQEDLERATAQIQQVPLPNGWTFYLKTATAADLAVASDYSKQAYNVSLALLCLMLVTEDGEKRFKGALPAAVEALGRWPADIVGALITSDAFRISEDPIGQARGN